MGRISKVWARGSGPGVGRACPSGSTGNRGICEAGKVLPSQQTDRRLRTRTEARWLQKASPGIKEKSPAGLGAFLPGTLPRACPALGASVLSILGVCSSADNEASSAGYTVAL